MSTEAPIPPRAWMPLTPRGVAAFARAPLWRLWLAQFIVALAAAIVVGWFLKEEWFPVARAAIHQLPPQGEIRGERLNWPGDSPVNLAENRFLGLSVDLNHGGKLERDAQLQVEFGRTNARVTAIFGYAVVAYPAGWRLAFNKTELDPWWGAWEPALVAIAATATFIGVFLSWQVLATLYCVPLWLITFYANRDLSLRQCWQLAGAALMPGALFMIFGIIFYGLTSVALVQVGIVACLHLVIGWIYLVISPTFLPRDPAVPASRGNPFKGVGKGKK